MKNKHIWGSQGEKLVFLHGLGGVGQLWLPFARNLSKEFQILTPDQLGHGSKVDAISKFHPLDYARDLIETVETFEFTNCWLIGHSMGSRSALAFAHLRPDLLKGLILVELGLEEKNFPHFADKWERITHFLANLPVHFASRKEASDFLEQNCPDSSFIAYILATAKLNQPKFNPKITLALNPQSLIETIKQASTFSFEPLLEEIIIQGIPILLLRGAKSQVWSVENFQHLQTRFSLYPHVSFKQFSQAGHGLPFEFPKAFLSQIKDFILEGHRPS